MRTIRNCVFETNSSSCHSITYIGKLDFEALRDTETLVEDVEVEVSERSVSINEVSHKQLLSLEEAVEKYRKNIEEVVNIPDGEDEWEVELVVDMKYIFPRYWGVPLLKYIFFDGDMPAEFDETAKKIAKRTYFTDYIFFLEEWLGLYIGSYKSLFERDGEARIKSNKRRGIGRNHIRKISTIISC